MRKVRSIILRAVQLVKDIFIEKFKMCELVEGENSKVCNKCGNLKSFDKFHKHKHCKYGFQTHCKICRGCENTKHTLCPECSDEEICQLYSKFGKISDVCKRINSSYYHVKPILDRNGLGDNSGIPVSDELNIIKLYRKGAHLTSTLAETFGLDEAIINVLIGKHCFSKLKSTHKVARKYPKYLINEYFFDVIDTQEKAYVLGLLYADGCNCSNSTRINLSLQEGDKQILEDITNLIQPTKPLRFVDLSNRVNAPGFGISKNQYSLEINSRHMSDRLTDLGCTPCKTLTLQFPTSEQVPNHLIRHFIRGYFDGDGGISGTKPIMYFEGMEDFNLQLQEVLIRELGFSKTKMFRRREGCKSVSMQYCGRFQVPRFANWIYEDCTICLKRKRDKFLTYDGVF